MSKTKQLHSLKLKIYHKSERDEIISFEEAEGLEVNPILHGQAVYKNKDGDLVMKTFKIQKSTPTLRTIGIFNVLTKAMTYMQGKKWILPKNHTEIQTNCAVAHNHLSRLQHYVDNNFHKVNGEKLKYEKEVKQLATAIWTLCEFNSFEKMTLKNGKMDLFAVKDKDIIIID